jgi:outer membrane receptor protein involved in Fe transport
VRDLLGGDFFVNVNQFAERDFVGNETAKQYNLDKPNQILHVGDKYGYDYYSTLHKASAWGQTYVKYNHVEGFLGANISDSYFWRTGNVANGLFPTNSKGDSKMINSFNYGVKGGLQGKINGRNYLYANAMYQTIAPTFRDAFVSPITRNVVLPNLKSEKVYSVEAGYIYKAPKLSIKANFFYTQFIDGIQNYTYYSDFYRTQVNYSLSGISKRHLGGELGVNWDIWKGISVNAVANVGKYTYTSRPSAFVTKDNNATAIETNKTIYLNNFNVERGPQMAYSIGLRYRSPQFWNVGLNLSYFDWMYVEATPARRVSDAIVGIDPASSYGQAILAQEKLKGQFTMDLRGGYSLFMNKMFRFKAKQRFYLQINWTISNLTNNKDFILYGNEQVRYDFKDQNTDKFATKYKYARGIGYFVSLNFRMQ